MSPIRSGGPEPRARRRVGYIGAAAAAALGLAVLPAIAVPAPAPSLAGSEFEIETDANLVLNTAGAKDWATVGEIRQADLPSGGGDDSFGQGTKEDTAVPTIVDGGIPPNKSDLRWFGAYQEGASSSGFLHLFWSRVQDPSGTTNMDFEFNQNKCTLDQGEPTPDSECSGNGVTPTRVAGDLLITYDLANGGSTAIMGKRVWDGSKWGAYAAFGSDAVGTINSSTITSANSDGLGQQDPRTFGEASLRLSAVLPQSTSQCSGFGSAYLKSRSSDSFSAALKDFIAPIPVNLTNCGSVSIIKTDDASPANRLNGAAFTLYTNVGNAKGVVFDSDPGTAVVEPATCTTSGTGSDAGTCTINNVPFGTYWVVETTTPSGYDTAADQQTTISSGAPAVTLTFVDPRQRGAVLVSKTRKDKSSETGASPHPGVTFTLKLGTTTVGSGTTDASGELCFDGLLFDDYTVIETVPDDYEAEDGSTTTYSKSVTVDSKATCSGSPYVGENVSFVNTPLSTIEVSFESQATGSTGPATAATIDCGDLTASPEDETPTAYDDESESFVDLPPGTYTCTVVVDP